MPLLRLSHSNGHRNEATGRNIVVPAVRSEMIVRGCQYGDGLLAVPLHYGKLHQAKQSLPQM